MKSKDQEQVGIFRRYLLARASRFRSRLIREQVRRWVEWVDEMQKPEHERRNRINEQLRRAA